MDFVIDGLETGRGVRALTTIDSYTRERLAIETDSCLSSRRVTRTLDWIIAQRRKPRVIRSDNGPEFLFQVVSDRAERAALIVTTNLPFTEWTAVFPNPRLCKALLDRVTDRAHIIETGTELFRFRTTMERRKKA